jgi:hypothetical protein
MQDIGQLLLRHAEAPSQIHPQYATASDFMVNRSSNGWRAESATPTIKFFERDRGAGGPLEEIQLGKSR